MKQRNNIFQDHVAANKDARTRILSFVFTIYQKKKPTFSVKQSVQSIVWLRNENRTGMC